MYQTILSALIWAFSFWMVADSLRRRASPWWIVGILLIQPYGGIAYLVYIKFAEARRARARLENAATAEQEPVPAGSARSSEPLLEVADQLEEQRRFGEAALIYRRALDQRQGNTRALHGLARCSIELGHTQEGIERYEALMALDPRYRNYAAALEYAEALHLAGRNADAMGLLEGLVSETGRLNHRLALAHYCEASGQTARARGVLSDALAAYECSPPPEQEANRRWQRRIVDKLQELAPS